MNYLIIIFVNAMSYNKTMAKIGCRLLSFLGLCLIFSSCSEYLKGKPFKTDYIVIRSDAKLDCLDNVSADMQKFLDSEGSGSEVDRTVNCINDTLTVLQTKVEGSVEASSYTASDVYKILSKFASRTNISQIAAENIILLKAALLGGETGKITKNEINQLKTYLLSVKDEAKHLSPYIKLFYFKKTEKAYTKTFIKEGFDQLNLSLKNLYKGSQFKSSNYSFENFKELIINVLNLSDDKKTMAEIAVKISSLLGGNQAVLNEADRMTYINNITELLRLLALYTNGYAKFEINNSAELNDSLELAEAVLNLLENSLQYKKTQIISVQTSDGLISSITNGDILPYEISGYTAAMFYRTVLVRVFESGAKGNITGFTGIKSIHLRNLKREIGIYKVYSKMLERVAGEEFFASRGIVSAPLREVQQALSTLNIADETEILNKYDSNLQAQIINSVNELRSEFLEMAPIIYHNSKIGIATNQNTWTQKWKDLARGLYVKMLSRFLMQGWGQIYPFENINTNYMTELDMVNWYSEFKHFGIAIKSFDPRIYSSGSAGFNTANLFTRAGNGDNKINFKEVAENLGILTSGSGGLYQEISKDLANARCNLPELDVFDNHWNFESCLYQVLRTNYKVYFSSLPHLVAYLDTLSESQFQTYFEDVVNVVRVDDSNKGNKVETADIRSMNALLHFVENLYRSHDTNANWHISEAEIKQAYPKFLNIATAFANKNSSAQIEEFTSWKGEVAGYGCFTKEHLIRESFVFLIYNGRTPESSDFNTLPCFRGKPLLEFNGEVDRKTLINTFKALKSVIGV